MAKQPTLQAPFPYFGGKSRIASLVWSRFGDVPNYVEPFFGSGAMLLKRPLPFEGIETVNDIDGLVSNFWRAVQWDPQATAHYADWPVNENDLHARHVWLVGQNESLQAKLEGDPTYYDVKIAGWWVWGICCWIGGGFCSGNGPWQSIVTEDGTCQLVRLGNAGQGVNRRRVHLSTSSQGVKRSRVHLSDLGQGVNRNLVHLSNAGNGVNRKLVHLGNAGKGIHEWFFSLQERLRRVRVCCGDWSRVCGPSLITQCEPAAIFLDPPYSDAANRAKNIYRVDSGSVAHDVREWAIKNGDDPRMRIALCGYEGEHEMPSSWEKVEWKTRGCYGNMSNGQGRINSHRERIWFSPHCLKPKSEFLPLFDRRVDFD